MLNSCHVYVLHLRLIVPYGFSLVASLNILFKLHRLSGGSSTLDSSVSQLSGFYLLSVIQPQYANTSPLTSFCFWMSLSTVLISKRAQLTTLPICMSKIRCMAPYELADLCEMKSTDASWRSVVRVNSSILNPYLFSNFGKIWREQNIWRNNWCRRTSGRSENMYVIDCFAEQIIPVIVIAYIGLVKNDVLNSVG